LGAGHHHGATFYQLQAFLAAIENRTPPAVSAADGLAAVAMGIAAERSAAEHRVVTIADVLGAEVLG
jgi:predicted dehydrogenase